MYVNTNIGAEINKSKRTNMCYLQPLWLQEPPTARFTAREHSRFSILIFAHVVSDTAFLKFDAFLWHKFFFNFIEKK